MQMFRAWHSSKQKSVSKYGKEPRPIIDRKRNQYRCNYFVKHLQIGSKSTLHNFYRLDASGPFY